MAKIITTQDFVSKFPSKIKAMNECLDDSSAKISHRTLRYYVTKGYMPKPIIKDRKSCYKNTPEIYQRLFVVLYLTNSLRNKSADINVILNSARQKSDFAILYKLISNKEFLQFLIEKKTIRKALNAYRA